MKYFDDLANVFTYFHPRCVESELGKTVLMKTNLFCPDLKAKMTFKRYLLCPNIEQVLKNQQTCKQLTVPVFNKIHTTCPY